MRLKAGKWSLGISILFFFGFISMLSNERFMKVLEKAPNDSIKKKLIKFEHGGIEKSVDTTQYDAEQIIDSAKTYLGTPHKMGGTTKKGIDCSGLVTVVHKKFGIQLPHSSQEQARFGMIISEQSDLKKGDLVFFYNSFQSKDFITHSGIYLGDGLFIHASHSRGVIISKINDGYYWRQRYLFATRLKDSEGS